MVVLTVKLEPLPGGRVKFGCVSKSSTSLELFSKMTDAQRHRFANKLSELPDMNKYSQGTESYPQFAVRIAEMLKDKEKFEELLPHLKKVGFSTK